AREVCELRCELCRVPPHEAVVRVCRDREAHAGTLRRSRLEHDDRDLAVGPRPVLVVVAPHLVRPPPEPLALLALGDVRASRQNAVEDLDLDVRVLREVLVPAGMLGRPAVGGDDHVAVAVPRVDERRRPRPAALPAGRGQQQDRRPLLPDVADLAAGLPVAADMVGAVQLLALAHSKSPSTISRRDFTRERVSCHSPSCHSTASPTPSSVRPERVAHTTRPARTMSSWRDAASWPPIRPSSSTRETCSSPRATRECVNPAEPKWSI